MVNVTPNPDPMNLIWIDLEMTGLSPETDRIIEIATVVTDKELNILAEGPVLAVHQSDELLAGMDEWNTRQHGGSGLTERVRQSLVSEAEAAAQTHQPGQPLRVGVHAQVVVEAGDHFVAVGIAAHV